MALVATFRSMSLMNSIHRSGNFNRRLLDPREQLKWNFINYLNRLVKAKIFKGLVQSKVFKVTIALDT